MVSGGSSVASGAGSVASGVGAPVGNPEDIGVGACVSGSHVSSLSKTLNRKSGNRRETEDFRKQAITVSGVTVALVKPAQLGSALQASPHSSSVPTTKKSGRLLPTTVLPYMAS